MIEFVYITGLVISLTAAIPQIRQLTVSKASDEFTMSTWLIWLAAQCTSLLYVWSIGNNLLVGANIIWVSFYVAMVYLIIHYRHFRRPVPETIEQ